VESNLLNRSLKFTSQEFFYRKQATSYLTRNLHFLSLEILGVPFSDYDVCCLEEGKSCILIEVYRHLRGHCSPHYQLPRYGSITELRNDSALVLQ